MSLLTYQMQKQAVLQENTAVAKKMANKGFVLVATFRQKKLENYHLVQPIDDPVADLRLNLVEEYGAFGSGKTQIGQLANCTH